MCFLSKVFAVTLLLSLAAADPTPEECAHLNKTLSAEELDAIFGKWIPHEAYFLHIQDYFNLTVNTCCHTEFTPSDNKQTVIFKQGYMVFETCTNYGMNFSVVGNTIQYTTATNSKTEGDFLKACDGCLMMRYTENDGKKGPYLVLYKKNETLPQADQEKTQEQAKCLGFPHPPLSIHNELDLCPEQHDDTKAKEPKQ